MFVSSRDVSVSLLRLLVIATLVYGTHTHATYAAPRARLSSAASLATAASSVPAAASRASRWTSCVYTPAYTTVAPPESSLSIHPLRSGPLKDGSAEWSRLRGLMCLPPARHSSYRSAQRTLGGGSIRAALITATLGGAPLNSSRARCRCTCEWRSARTLREARAGACGLAPCSWRAGSSAKHVSCRCKAAGCWSWAAAWGYLRSRQRSWAPRASPRTACLCCCARWSAARARTTRRGALASRSWTGTTSPRAP